MVQAAADRTGSWFQTKPLLNAIKVLLLILKSFILVMFNTEEMSHLQWTCFLMAQFQLSINLTGRKFSYAEMNLASTENPDTEQSQKLL